QFDARLAVGPLDQAGAVEGGRTGRTPGVHGADLGLGGVESDVTDRLLDERRRRHGELRQLRGGQRRTRRGQGLLELLLELLDGLLEFLRHRNVEFAEAGNVDRGGHRRDGGHGAGGGDRTHDKSTLHGIRHTRFPLQAVFTHRPESPIVSCIPRRPARSRNSEPETAAPHLDCGGSGTTAGNAMVPTADKAGDLVAPSSYEVTPSPKSREDYDARRRLSSGAGGVSQPL